MTIHNLFITLLVLFWVCILLFLSIALQLDRLEAFCRKRKVKKLETVFRRLFLEPAEPSSHTVQKAFRQSDDIVFLPVITAVYVSLKKDPVLDHDTLNSFCMIRVLERRIQAISDPDILGKCLILRSIFESGLTSPVIDEFVLSCAGRSSLEQYWVGKIKNKEKGRVVL